MAVSFIGGGNHFSYIMAVSFIGGGNQSTWIKPYLPIYFITFILSSNYTDIGSDTSYKLTRSSPYFINSLKHIMFLEHKDSVEFIHI